jgi:hypothetical protein
MLHDLLKGENSMQIPNRWIWGEGEAQESFLAPWPERGMKQMKEVGEREVALDTLLLFNVNACALQYTVCNIRARRLCHCGCGTTNQTGVGRRRTCIVVVMRVWRKNRQPTTRITMIILAARI